MGYRQESGMYADTDPIAFAAPGTVISATGSSGVLEIGDRGTARITVAVSAVAGSSPTLDIALMTCDTRAGTFRQVGTFTQITGTGSSRKSLGGCDRFIRLDYTIGGTGSPSLTVGIDGEAA